MEDMLLRCHTSPYVGHFGRRRTIQKTLQSGFYWPTMIKVAYEFAHRCNRCQWHGNISKRDEVPQTKCLEVEVFNVWDLDFLGPFPSSFGDQYILIAVEYVLKWVEVVVLPTNNIKVVVRFLRKRIFFLVWDP